MNLEQMKKIVDGAPDGVRYYCTSANIYHLCDDLNGFECCVSIADLRTELAKREPMGLRAVGIPHGTIVLEK
jgi:hypothetical protein